MKAFYLYTLYVNYATRVKEFEGPLDVLLGLIETKRLSINEVSLGRVTEEFFTYLKTLKEKNPRIYHTEIASFLVVAATLMLIKSRALLDGFIITEEEEGDIKELEDRLRAYKAVKEMAWLLDKIAVARKPLFSRQAFLAITPAFIPPPTRLDPADMLKTLKSLLESLPQKNELPQKTVAKIVSIEEKIKELETRIKEGVVKTFGDFVGGKKERAHIVVSFLAMLELIKIGTIAAAQKSAFTHIQLDHGTRKNS